MILAELFGKWIVIAQIKNLPTRRIFLWEYQFLNEVQSIEFTAFSSNIWTDTWYRQLLGHYIGMPEGQLDTLEKIKYPLWKKSFHRIFIRNSSALSARDRYNFCCWFDWSVEFWHIWWYVKYKNSDQITGYTLYINLYIWFIVLYMYNNMLHNYIMGIGFNNKHLIIDKEKQNVLYWTVR